MKGKKEPPGRPPSGGSLFFRKAEVTAEAVTYKAKAESKSAGESACATEAKIGAGAGEFAGVLR
jgi:hypothetical protein